MNIQLTSFIDPSLLAQDVERLSFHLDGSGAEMAFPPCGGIPEIVKSLPILRRALNEILAYRQQPILHVMVNRLKPRVRVQIHRDFLLATPLQARNHPTIERWHLPVITNDQAFWWDEEHGQRHLPLGFWVGPVPYWLRHQVTNDGPSERVHLVVDLDTETRMGEYRD